jgi:hypothetical protein
MSYNVELNFLRLGLAKERVYTQKLNSDIKETDRLAEINQKLIHLNAKLSLGEHVLSDDEMATFDYLKTKGIEILNPEERKISCERMSEIKASIGSHSDRLKMEMQKNFSTKIQVTISEMNSILESLKTSEKSNSRLIEFIISHMTKQ